MTSDDAPKPADAPDDVVLRLPVRTIIDRTHVPMLVIARDGRVLLANESLRQLLGEDPTLRDDVLARRASADDRMRVLRAHARGCRGQSTAGLEIALLGVHGTVRMRVDFEPLQTGESTVEAVLAVGLDVTRERQLEDEVQHADRLAVVGQLAAGVVHELNNPLTSILVYSEYVLRRVEQRGDAADADKLRRIVAAADRIQSFARNLTTYARVDRGEREPVAITHVTDESIALCEPLLDRRGVILTRSYGTEPAVVLAVRGQLQQVFINLITNAAQAVTEGRGRIHVSVTTTEGGTVVVAVEDDGPGVSDDEAETIFRPFVTSKPAGQGTGLGLPIVRRLVERHGGSVTVTRSRLGGARFEVVLPPKPPSERPPAPAGL